MLPVKITTWIAIDDLRCDESEFVLTMNKHFIWKSLEIELGRPGEYNDQLVGFVILFNLLQPRE